MGSAADWKLAIFFHVKKFYYNEKAIPVGVMLSPWPETIITFRFEVPWSQKHYQFKFFFICIYIYIYTYIHVPVYMYLYYGVFWSLFFYSVTKWKQKQQCISTWNQYSICLSIFSFQQNFYLELPSTSSKKAKIWKLSLFPLPDICLTFQESDARSD